MLARSVLSKVDAAALYLQGEPQEAVSIRGLSERHLHTEPRVWLGAAEGVLLPPTESDGWQIAVRWDLSPERARLVAAHELAHWYFECVDSYQGRDLEQRCDALAAVIVAPAIAVCAAAERHGLDVHAIAEELRTTQSVALLRLGEVVGVPTALLRKHRSTIIRGPFARWPMPLSWQPAKRDLEGVTKVEITDEPRRFGVMLAG